MATQEGGESNHSSFSNHTSRGRTSTQGLQFATGHQRPQNHVSSANAPNTVYVVTDTCYPKAADFSEGKGVTAVFSVHSSMEAANAKAKKIIFANEGGCTVDVDKVIEETRRGLYTGIGIGGEEEKADHCYARKCEVEAKVVDEDSEDESGESNESALGERDDDVMMG